MQEDEPKKNYYLVYGAVATMYLIMIIVYSVVVHNATENGAAENVKCVPSDLNKCPDDPDTPTSLIEGLIKSIVEAFA